MTELSSTELESYYEEPLEFNVLSAPGEEPRIISTSGAKTRKIMELSHVTFTAFGPGAFPEAHQAVLDGESMGQAFAQRGIRFDHHFLGFYRYDLPDIFGRLYDEDGPALVRDVQILVGPQQIHYANLLETFSPDYQREKGYFPGEPTDNQRARIRYLTRFLENFIS